MTALRRLVVAVVVAALVMFGGGGWYYSTQVLDPGVPGPVARDMQVTAISDDTVTLQSIGAPSWALQDLRSDIVVGFGHDRGYLRLSGEPIGMDGASATRNFAVLRGTPPAVGDRGSIEVRAFPEDPTILDLGVQDVTIDSDLGGFPGWVVPGNGANADRWIVFVHGRGGTRGTALRAIEAVVGDLGYSALAITLRNDPGAPPSPDGHGHFGDTEWQDLQAWLEWLRDQHDPADVTLFGFSQGGSVVAACMRRCDDTTDVAGLVLDSPLLSISETLELQSRQRGIPRFLVRPLLASTETIAGLRGGPDFDRLEHVMALAEMDLPILAFHGTEDASVPDGPTRALRIRDPEQVTLVGYDGDHVRGWNVDREAYVTALADFLSQG